MLLQRATGAMVLLRIFATEDILMNRDRLRNHISKNGICTVIIYGVKKKKARKK
jgi:hypothetical protein